jgi:hypothetical protein
MLCRSESEITKRRETDDLSTFLSKTTRFLAG